jgi:penicillin-binding protein 1A
MNTRHGGQEFHCAGHIAEMARQVMYERYGDEIYASGLNVYITIRQVDQVAATPRCAKVMDYDARHGYRGRKVF